MGCVFSRPECENNPRIFHVWNVDGDGRHLKPGRIEVTDTQLILHQKNNLVVRWPLTCLRRYGFDSEVFSFECGRRCATGPGVYAFKCRRAQQLFSVLQECINNSGGGGGGGAGNSSASVPSIEDQMSLATGGERILHSPPNGNLPSVNGGSCPTVDSSGYLEPINANSHLHYPARTAPVAGSPGGYVCIHSDGGGANWPSLPNCCSAAHHYTNGDVAAEHRYANASVAASERLCEAAYVNSPLSPGQLGNCVDVNTNYAKLDDLLKQEQSAKRQKEQPFYVNVKPDAVLQSGSSASSKCVSGRSSPAESRSGTLSPGSSRPPRSRCYENLGSPASDDNPEREEDQVNYAVLDLEQSDCARDALVSPASAPNSFSRENSLGSSPVRSPEGYAQIDFDKTVALSNSANPCPFNDDSMRKTRHNAAVPFASMSA